MGVETADWYNNFCLIGFADQRGKAWHYRQSAQGAEPNHYSGAIPVDDVLRRLFYWNAVSGTVETTYTDENGVEQTFVDPTRQTIIRPDTQTVFGVFRQTYEIHQHSEWLVDTAHDILDSSKGELGIANAVLLRKGAVAAVQFEVPESIKTPQGVEFRPSLLCAGSLDGSLSTTYARVCTNVVCDNTMASALSERNAAKLKIKHSKYSKLRIGEARDALEIIFDIADEFAEQVAALSEIKVSGKQFKQLVNILAPLPEGDKKPSKALTMAEKKQDHLLTLWMSDPRVAPWSGSAWGVLQMNNTYNQHIVGTNGDTVRGERNMFDAASGKLAKSDTEIMDILFQKVLVDA